jgi:hypothetical protein
MGGNDDRILVASDMALGRVGGRWRRKNQAAREKKRKGGEMEKGGLTPASPPHPHLSKTTTTTGRFSLPEISTLRYTIYSINHPAEFCSSSWLGRDKEKGGRGERGG